MSEPWPAGRAASGDDGADKGLLDVGPTHPDLPPEPPTLIEPPDGDEPSGRDEPLGGDGSLLRGVDYSAAAECLWRWVDAPADATVSAFLTGYARMDAVGRRALGAGLCPDDLYTLVTFARRRAFAAIRTGACAEVRAAFEALSAVELNRIDWRDVWVTTALAAYAAERLGMAPAEAVREAAQRAEPELAALLTEVTADSVDLAQECGYRVLETPTGRVLLDDEGRAYTPEVDLAGLALDTAVLVEQHDYRVGHVSVAAELPDSWLGGAGRAAVRAARQRLTGCAYVHAESSGTGATGGADVLLVFLAEAASAGDAAQLADAAVRYPASGAVGWGVAAGRHCAVVVARSAVLGMPTVESRATLARFGPQLAAILPSGRPSAG